MRPETSFQTHLNSTRHLTRSHECFHCQFTGLQRTSNTNSNKVQLQHNCVLRSSFPRQNQVETCKLIKFIKLESQTVLILFHFKTRLISIDHHLKVIFQCTKCTGTPFTTSLKSETSFPIACLAVFDHLESHKAKTYNQLVSLQNSQKSNQTLIDFNPNKLNLFRILSSVRLQQKLFSYISGACGSLGVIYFTYDISIYRKSWGQMATGLQIAHIPAETFHF